jgi:site-specific recombinase XerD
MSITTVDPGSPAAYTVGMTRPGASLPEIGQILRHREQKTTAIYAKVDHAALRPLARPWPTPAGAS